MDENEKRVLIESTTAQLMETIIAATNQLESMMERELAMASIVSSIVASILATASTAHDGHEEAVIAGMLGTIIRGACESLAAYDGGTGETLWDRREHDAGNA